MVYYWLEDCLENLEKSEKKVFIKRKYLRKDASSTYMARSRYDVRGSILEIIVFLAWIVHFLLIWDLRDLALGKTPTFCGQYSTVSNFLGIEATCDVSLISMWVLRSILTVSFLSVLYVYFVHKSKK